MSALPDLEAIRANASTRTLEVLDWADGLERALNAMLNASAVLLEGVTRAHSVWEVDASADLPIDGMSGGLALLAQATIRARQLLPALPLNASGQEK